MTGPSPVCFYCSKPGVPGDSPLHTVTLPEAMGAEDIEAHAPCLERRGWEYDASREPGDETYSGTWTWKPKPKKKVEAKKRFKPADVDKLPQPKLIAALLCLLVQDHFSGGPARFSIEAIADAVNAMVDSSSVLTVRFEREHQIATAVMLDIEDADKANADEFSAFLKRLANQILEDHKGPVN